MPNGNQAIADRCARYRMLVRQGVTLLRQINANAHPQDANCPETADAVNDFLNTGRARSVRTASSTAIFQFPRGTRWTTVNLNATVSRLGNCSHVVIRGLRGASASGVTPEHYFVVFKVDNVVWVADAYTGELTRNVLTYINAEPPAQRMTTFQVLAGGAYDVIVSDPLSGL